MLEVTSVFGLLAHPVALNMSMLLFLEICNTVYHWFFFLCVRFFENIYIGWGQKYYPNSFTPLSPPSLMEEYPEDLNCQEQDDPTVEEEQNLKEREDEALRAAQEMENAEEEDDNDD